VGLLYPLSGLFVPSGTALVESVKGREAGDEGAGDAAGDTAKGVAGEAGLGAGAPLGALQE
jgi:hypothetical protein